MSSVDGAARATTAMGADLQAGLDTLDLNQVVTFLPYTRVVLPIDGYVFWVSVQSLGRSSLYNVMPYGRMPYGKPTTPSLSPAPFLAKGSLHYSTEMRQQEAANSSANRVLFTAEEPIQNFNDVNTDLLYIATFDGPQPTSSQSPADTSAIRFAFSSRSSFYQQAGLWHYVGSAVYSTMDSQIVNDPRSLSTRQQIVSNSLPAWLALNAYNPPWPVPVPEPAIVLYPSFLVPDNLSPPYGVVHIAPGSTISLQAMPRLTVNSSQYGLAQDRVTVTLYGCNNDVAQSFLYSAMQYSYDVEAFGLMNMPVVRDEKEFQVELRTLSQKKSILFDVSYNQTDIRNVARQLIESCIPTVTASDKLPIFTVGS